jgi:hypothetical protein
MDSRHTPRPRRPANHACSAAVGAPAWCGPWRFLRLRVPTQEHAHCTRPSPVSSATKPSFLASPPSLARYSLLPSRTRQACLWCQLCCAHAIDPSRTRQRLPVSALPQGGTACIAPRTNTACCSRIASHPSMRAVIVASPRSNGRPGARPVRPLMQLYKVAA